MTKSAVLTSRVTGALLAQIDVLASELDRTRAWIVAAAVERYVTEELAFIERIREGERDLAVGNVFAQEEVEATFEERVAKRNAA